MVQGETDIGEITIDRLTVEGVVYLKLASVLEMLRCMNESTQHIGDVSGSRYFDILIQGFLALNTPDLDTQSAANSSDLH